MAACGGRATNGAENCGRILPLLVTHRKPRRLCSFRERGRFILLLHEPVAARVTPAPGRHGAGACGSESVEAHPAQARPRQVTSGLW
jgi:hypothetical protein